MSERLVTVSHKEWPAEVSVLIIWAFLFLVKVFLSHFAPVFITLCVILNDCKNWINHAIILSISFWWNLNLSLLCICWFKAQNYVSRWILEEITGTAFYTAINTFMWDKSHNYNIKSQDYNCNYKIEIDMVEIMNDEIHLNTAQLFKLNWTAVASSCNSLFNTFSWIFVSCC